MIGFVFITTTILATICGLANNSWSSFFGMLAVAPVVQMMAFWVWMEIEEWRCRRKEEQ